MCFSQGLSTRTHTTGGSNSRPCDHESGTLPLIRVRYKKNVSVLLPRPNVISQAYTLFYVFIAEANYAYKLKRPIIPLLMEEGYDPDGWLGIILGTKLYYKFTCDQETDVDGLLKGIKELNIGKGE